MIIDVQGVRLFVESRGDGPPLLLIHGLGVTSCVWHAAHSVLSRHFRVITFDLSGSGRSDRSPRNFSIETWADDIAGLLDALQIPRAIIVGHSMGSMIAQRFAAHYPTRTRALVLAGGLTELAPPAKEIYAQRAALVEKDGMATVVDLLVAGALTSATREGNLSLTGLLRDVYLSNDPACYAGHCRALSAASVKSEQPSISCPTLLLVGDQDSLTPLALQCSIAAAIPNSCIHIVPRTAHMTMLEEPSTFNTLVLEFLSRPEHI